MSKSDIGQEPPMLNNRKHSAFECGRGLVARGSKRVFVLVFECLQHIPHIQSQLIDACHVYQDWNLLRRCCTSEGQILHYYCRPSAPSCCTLSTGTDSTDWSPTLSGARNANSYSRSTIYQSREGFYGRFSVQKAVNCS